MRFRYGWFVLILGMTGSNVVQAHAGVNASQADLDEVEVQAKAPPRDEKPYRNLQRAMTVFEESRSMAPGAVMRFKVFPWHDESVMTGLKMTLLGKTFKRPIPLADDGTFVVEPDVMAADENARVISNRPPRSLAWRADIRTPGLPLNTRRLGDLRLECKVDVLGAGADLATGIKTPSFWAVAAVSNPCMNNLVGYMWIANEPVFSVTLLSGSRRQTLPITANWTSCSGVQ